jgi:hypothetical protein
VLTKKLPSDFLNVDAGVDAQTRMTYATLTASSDGTVAVSPTGAVAVLAASSPRAGDSLAFVPYRKWTVDEDAKLTDAVKEHGANDWVRVAAMVPGRRNTQCRKRWLDSLDLLSETAR